jgi:hypothetical protein
MSSSEEIRRRAAERLRMIEAAQAADRRATNADASRRGSDTQPPRRADSTPTRPRGDSR